MCFRPLRAPAIAALISAAAVLAAIAAGCGDDNGDATRTATVTQPSPTSAATLPPQASPSPGATPATTPAAVDPCTLRMSLEGGSLSPGPSFELDGQAWQLCVGGAAAGSSEKYLFGSADGGASWDLLAMTTLGNPPPEPGVGELPNGNAAEALVFVDATTGWLGLSSPGQNLFRSEDGGVTWTPVDGLPAGLPVLEITFTDAQNGALTTPEGEWTTSDGGETWNPPV